MKASLQSFTKCLDLKFAFTSTDDKYEVNSRFPLRVQSGHSSTVYIIQWGSIENFSRSY